MKNILIISLPGIGNTLLLTPIIEDLRKNFKDSIIKVLVMYEGCEEVLIGNKYVDDVLLFEFKKQGYIKSLIFLKNLRREKFDISILPHPSNRYEYNLVSFLIGAKIRISHKYPYFKLRSLGFLNNSRINLGNMHEIEENQNLMKLVGLNPNGKNRHLLLPINSTNMYQADKFLSNNKISGFKIGIHPGSSNLAGMHNKRWPKERFVELSEFLIQKYRASILIFGGPEEESLKNYVRDSLKMKNKVFIVNSKSIPDTAAIIKKCNLFVTNDSGLMHVAVSVNVPVVAISGAADYRKTYPINKNSAIIYHDIYCYPCYRFGERLECKRKEKDYACLKYISIYHVANLIERIMKNERMGPILEGV